MIYNPLLFQLLSCIISQRWSNLVESVDLSNWKEALAILLSYAKPTEFNGLCGKSTFIQAVHVSVIHFGQVSVIHFGQHCS